MMTNERLRPIRIAGACAIFIGAVPVIFLFLHPGSRLLFRRIYEEGAGAVLVVAGIFEAYLIVTGIGAVLLKRWGYYLFKSLLYLFLVLGFPIFTLPCWLMLRYMRRNGIDEGFFSA